VSQNHFKTSIGSLPVVVTAGWDRPLQGFFMFVEQDDEELLYCNLDDPEIESCGGLPPSFDYFVTKANTLGFQIPQNVIDQVLLDCHVNAGNKKRWF
jgi:hypothetical protein